MKKDNVVELSGRENHSDTVTELLRTGAQEHRSTTVAATGYRGRAEHIHGAVRQSPFGQWVRCRC